MTLYEKTSSLSSESHNIATVISYCSNDYRFLSKCIEEALCFSRQVIVPACDHFFNGQKEDIALLESSYAKNPRAQFIEFSYYSDKLYSKWIECSSKDKYWNLYWNGTARYIGLLHALDSIDYVLFLDADEIVDGRQFLSWLDNYPYREKEIIRFQNYLYFRSASNRALTLQKLPLLIEKSKIRPHILMNVDDRHGVMAQFHENAEDKVSGLDEKPMFHHYSWVRTKEECLQKTNSWGHWWEKDWKNLIEKEYAKPFDGTDFVFDHQYETVQPYFDPLKVLIPNEKRRNSSFANVQKVGYHDIVKRELMYEFGLDLDGTV